MLASRVRQSINGAGPTSFTLSDDAASTNSRTIVSAYGSGSSKVGIFTIVDIANAMWAVVMGYAIAGSPDTFTVTKTIRNSQGTATNLTWNLGAKTIFAGECADFLAPLTQCPSTGGSATAYTLTLTPAPLALIGGTVIRFFAHVLNGPNVTLSVNGLPPWPITRSDGAAIAAGQCAGICEVVVDAVNSRFLLFTASPSLPAAWGGGVSDNNWVQLPNGLIFQFMSGSAGGNGADFVNFFPRAFPTACIHAQAIHNGGAESVNIVMPARTASTVTLRSSWPSGNVGVSILAYGY